VSVLKTLLYRSLSTFVAIWFGFAVAVLIAEAGLRLFFPQIRIPVMQKYHKDLGRIQWPGKAGRVIYPGIYDWSFSNNSRGFRGAKEFTIARKDSYRILLLGDSFTYGTGVNDDETFAHRIELGLSDVPVEVINAGNGGTGTDYGLKFFVTLGVEFRPDLVALCFYANDFKDNERLEYFAVDEKGSLQVKALDQTVWARKAFLASIPGYDWLCCHSHFFNLLKQRAIHFLKNRSQNVVIDYGGKTSGFSTVAGRRLTKVFIQHLKKAADAEGIEFVIFYIPSEADLNTFRTSNSCSCDESSLLEIAAATSTSAASLTLPLACSGNSIEQLYFSENHWRPIAHRIAGSFMSSYIRQERHLIMEREAALEFGLR
jgi:hypothetical protein